MTNEPNMKAIFNKGNGERGTGNGEQEMRLTIYHVFDVSCIIILGNWFAKFLLVMVSLNSMFKGEFTDG